MATSSIFETPIFVTEEAATALLDALEDSLQTESIKTKNTYDLCQDDCDQEIVEAIYIKNL